MSELNQTQIDASQESFQKPLTASPARRRDDAMPNPMEPRPITAARGCGEDCGGFSDGRVMDGSLHSSIGQLFVFRRLCRNGGSVATVVIKAAAGRGRAGTRSGSADPGMRLEGDHVTDAPNREASHDETRSAICVLGIAFPNR